MNSQYLFRIKTLIVDDEPFARTNLAKLLEPDPEIVLIGECGSGQEAIAAVRKLRPDLLLLDVQMPECDGFDVLETIGGMAPRAIIFVTAFDSYAVKAFEVAALDYVLKPIQEKRLQQSLGRVKEQLSKCQKTNEWLDRFVIKSTGRVLFLAAREVDWIEAADYYACLHTNGKNHLLRRTMSELEHELDPGIFCRIHRGAIVNLHRVRGLELDEQGEYDVLLRDGVRLRLSRTYRREVQARLSLLANQSES